MTIVARTSPHDSLRCRRRSSIVAVAGLVGLLALTSCSKEPDRDSTGSITEEGELDVFSIREGDCFDDGSSEEVSSVTAIPCDGPHDNEVTALIDATEQTFPGSDALGAAYAEACDAAFERYVGVPASESFLVSTALLVPTFETWATGDREIVCGLYHPDFAKLNDSMRGAGDRARTQEPAEGAPPEPGASSMNAAATATADELCATLDDLAVEAATADATARAAISARLTELAEDAAVIATADPAAAATVSECLTRLSTALMP